MTVLAPALLAAAATAALLRRPGSATRLRGLVAPVHTVASSTSVRRPPGPRLACLLAAAGVAVVVGGPIGLLLAAALAVAGPGLLGRLEPRASREQAQRLAKDLPARTRPAGGLPDRWRGAAGRSAGGRGRRSGSLRRPTEAGCRGVIGRLTTRRGVVGPRGRRPGRGECCSGAGPLLRRRSSRGAVRLPGRRRGPYRVPRAWDACCPPGRGARGRSAGPVLPAGLRPARRRTGGRRAGDPTSGDPAVGAEDPPGRSGPPRRLSRRGGSQGASRHGSPDRLAFVNGTQARARGSAVRSDEPSTGRRPLRG